jgi:hypothetical protein
VCQGFSADQLPSPSTMAEVINRELRVSSNKGTWTLIEIGALYLFRNYLEPEVHSLL